MHELVVRTGEIGAAAIEQETQSLGVLLELVLALGDRWERHPVRRELHLIPSRPETAIGAAAGEVIDRAERLREHARVPVADAEDEATDADLRRLHRRRGQRRDRFEAIAVPTLRWRLLEVIRYRKPVEPALVGEPPEASHLGERTAEVTEMYPEPSTRNPSMGRRTAWVRTPACSSRGPGSPSAGSIRRRPRCRRPQARDPRAETRGRAREPSSCFEDLLLT